MGGGEISPPLRPWCKEETSDSERLTENLSIGNIAMQFFCGILVNWGRQLHKKHKMIFKIEFIKTSPNFKFCINLVRKRVKRRREEGEKERNIIRNKDYVIHGYPMLQWLLQLAVLLDIKYNHLLSQETLVHTLIIVIIIMSFTFLVNQNCS